MDRFELVGGNLLVTTSHAAEYRPVDASSTASGLFLREISLLETDGSLLEATEAHRSSHRVVYMVSDVPPKSGVKVACNGKEESLSERDIVGFEQVLSALELELPELRSLLSVDADTPWSEASILNALADKCESTLDALNLSTAGVIGSIEPIDGPTVEWVQKIRTKSLQRARDRLRLTAAQSG